MRADHTDAPAGCEYATVYIAFELSKSKWQLGVMTPGAEKMGRYRIGGGKMGGGTWAGLACVWGGAGAKAEQLGKPVRILSCYEAGLDGHWLHRWLSNNGIVSYGIDAQSIDGSRRAAGGQ